jgi:two-component system NtrC family response regulator
MAEGDYIQPQDIDLVGADRGLPKLKEARDMAEISAIRQALARHSGNISKAAQDLDVSRPTLHDLLKKHRVTIQK